MSSLNTLPLGNNVTQEDRIKWQNATDGALDFLRSFDNVSADTIDIPTIQKYLDQRKSAGTPLTAIETDIDAEMKLLQDPDPKIRLQAEQKLAMVVNYMKEHQTIIENTRQEIDVMREGNPDVIDNVYDWTTDKAKRALGAVKEGFDHSNGKEKILMLLGIGAISMMLWNGAKTEKGKAIWNRLKGTGIALIGIAAIAKLTEKSTGKTLISQAGLLPSEKETAAKEMELAYQELFTTSVPDKFLNGVTDKDQKFAYGVTNTFGLTAEELEKIYTTNQKTMRVEDGDGTYPHSPITDDKLSPTERYILIENIGETLGLIDPKTKTFLTIPPEAKGRTVLQLALEGWKKP